MAELKTKLGRLELQNPIVTASGTFGYGTEFTDFVDLDRIGAITLKSVTMEAKIGNIPPRIAETPSGMMNSIGLENNGIQDLIKRRLPALEGYKNLKVIANIAGHSIEENIECARILEKEKRVDALELNISCPNVAAGGLSFCFDLPVVEKLISKVRDEYSGPLIVKLSASVPDIVKLAEVSIKAGAEILSLINTIPAMEVDITSRKLFFKRGVAGLSGPAIRPIALKAIYDVASHFKIPIIGIGGVSSIEDVLKFLIIGADAVSIGMMNFINPKIAETLIDELDEYLNTNKLTLAELTLQS
ncbi:MAG: dihydroorotate dehydrogenase B catalytic subunit [Candidatus Margulisbacteria bacterium GWF2_35_9]|nr:MAG: dihydroorotate dehydrogenase B catalytic subunit [Candidatus Margulisbacteria bacterium GWF2_35_9]